MSDEATPSRLSRVAVALATVIALTILGSLAWTLTTPAPPRPVAFVGGDHDDAATCHSAVAWDGRVAHTACAWLYRDRALVELDPETAQATVLHRWSHDDGNTPDLRILQACGDGQLFVLAETRQTTLVTRRAGEIHAYTANTPGSDVLGATCVDHGVELFVAEDRGYAVLRVSDATVERLRAIPAADVAGTIVGAWSEGDAWHAVATTRSGELLAGPLASPLAPVAAAGPDVHVCAIGQPGGWLGIEGRRHCSTARALTHVDGAFRVAELTRLREGLVVDVGPGRGHGVTLLDGDASQFRGRGALDFDLHARDRLFTAQRDPAAPVEVAQARDSSLVLGARALPLTGERVAVWGSLGSDLLILGPDLRRLDEPGLLQRTLSPFGRFRSSAKSTFDQVCYFTLLAASLAWLLVLATYRGTDRRAGHRRAAALMVVLFVVGAAGFYKVLAWL